MPGRTHFYPGAAVRSNIDHGHIGTGTRSQEIFDICRKQLSAAIEAEGSLQPEFAALSQLRQAAIRAFCDTELVVNNPYERVNHDDVVMVASAGGEFASRGRYSKHPVVSNEGALRDVIEEIKQNKQSRIRLILSAKTEELNTRSHRRYYAMTRARDLKRLEEESKEQGSSPTAVVSIGADTMRRHAAYLLHRDFLKDFKEADLGLELRYQTHTLADGATLEYRLIYDETFGIVFDTKINGQQFVWRVEELAGPMFVARHESQLQQQVEQQQ